MGDRLITLIKEGVGIRSASRILKISPSTVINKILRISEQLKPLSVGTKSVFELDELCTFIGKKDKYIWVAYALCRSNGKVVAFHVGKRTNKTLRTVVVHVLCKAPRKIFTDKLKNYKHLIPEYLHSTKQFGTNRIEAKNTSLRTHLKRLNRRTICYSKSICMLTACLKIYFWG